MSVKHPIIAVTGSSGAGTSTVKNAFVELFEQLDINAAVVEGDSFHRYNRVEMAAAVREAEKKGKSFSHFSPQANLFDELEILFREYSERGAGQARRYLHNDEDPENHFGQPSGTFTPWQPLPDKTNLLFYEGLHGGIITDTINVAQWVDLLVGVVPSINLEWVQKTYRDHKVRGYSTEAVQQNILRSMPDYFRYMLPQFSRTHINFQRIPLVDTANPFTAKSIPSADESLMVIHFRQYQDRDYPYLLAMIDGSFMSGPHTLAIPGGKMQLAIQVIFASIIEDMLEQSRQASLF